MISEYLLIGTKNILVDFSFISSKVFPNVNIQKTMLHFYFPSYLFVNKPTRKPVSDIFNVKWFSYWNKVNERNKGLFLIYMGKDLNSAQRFIVKCLKNLKNKSFHIKKMVERQTSKEIINNWLHIKSSIYIVHWLIFQACAFRAHDDR